MTASLDTSTLRRPSLPVLPVSTPAASAPERAPVVASVFQAQRFVDSFAPAEKKKKPAPKPPENKPTPTEPGPVPTTIPGDLKDQALIKAIHDFAAKHDKISYSQARQVIFGQLDNHDGKVTDVYTGRTITTNKPPSANDMNVEHTWPKSHGVKGTPAESDLHHLFPTDSKANSRRSSFPFGVPVNVKWSDNGSKLGTDKSGATVFEPPDEHKGNVARAIFYVASIYGMKIPPAEEAVLKQWNAMDQVDAAEIARNDAIEQIQHNRNPFVDDATLADRIADF